MNLLDVIKENEACKYAKIRDVSTLGMDNKYILHTFIREDRRKVGIFERGEMFYKLTVINNNHLIINI